MSKEDIEKLSESENPIIKRAIQKRFHAFVFNYGDHTDNDFEYNCHYDHSDSYQSGTGRGTKHNETYYDW